MTSPGLLSRHSAAAPTYLIVKLLFNVASLTSHISAAQHPTGPQYQPIILAFTPAHPRASPNPSRPPPEPSPTSTLLGATPLFTKTLKSASTLPRKAAGISTMGIPYSREINAAFSQVTPLVAAGYKVLRTTKNISILLAAIQVLTVVLLGAILVVLVGILYAVNPDLEVRWNSGFSFSIAGDGGGE